MAIHDAIAAAASDWDAIEPYLTPAHLSAIARTLASDEDVSALEERLLQILSPVIPAEHEVWSELRRQQSRRTQRIHVDDLNFDEKVRLPMRIIGFRVFTALTSEDHAKDAVADAIVESTKRRILGFGYRFTPAAATRDYSPPAGAIGITLDNGVAYPAFQFADAELTEVHPAFRSGAELLGAYEDPLGALAWWTTPNAWIGRAPATLLGTSRESEVFYAVEQLRNDSW